MVLCGHCKQHHATVNDVRACSAGGAVQIEQERSKAPEPVATATKVERRPVAGLANSQVILSKDHEGGERGRAKSEQLKRQQAEQTTQTQQELRNQEKLVREYREGSKLLKQKRKRKADLAQEQAAPPETKELRAARLQLAREQRQRETELLMREQLRVEKQRAEVKVREELAAKKRQEQLALENERFERLTPEQRKRVKEMRDARLRLPSTDTWRDY